MTSSLNVKKALRNAIIDVTVFAITVILGTRSIGLRSKHFR